MGPERFVVGSPFGEKAQVKSLRLKGLMEAAEALLKEAGCEIVWVKGTTEWSEPILPDTGKVNFPALKCR